MKKRSYPILFIFWTFFCLPSFGFSQETKDSISWTNQLDTLFRTAVNSPDYLVIKKSDWNEIKSLVNDSISSKIRLAKEIQVVRTTLDSTSYVQTSKFTTFEKPEATFDKPVLLFLVALLVYGGIITFRLYAQREKVKVNQDILDETEKEFLNHKKSSVERERKLMRELIDTRNKLEEVMSNSQAS